jgi:two-component system, response regulator, stage 0 sporulation protein F
MGTSRESNLVGCRDEPQRSERARLWIVVADENEDTRCRVADALRAVGYTVFEASDGIDLLDYVSAPLPHRQLADHPTAIIMALSMRGVSGLAILGGLRDASCPTPIVLLTEPLHHELRRSYRRLGANAIFEKPFDVDDLCTAVLNLAPDTARGGDWHHVLQHTAPAQAIPDDTIARAG